MLPTLADVAPHRARFVWLAAALASISMFVLTRPAAPQPRHYPQFSGVGLGHCVDSNGVVRAVRVDVVPSYVHKHK